MFLMPHITTKCPIFNLTQIKREFEYIKDYRLLDENCTGESTVEIKFINGTTETFELAALSDLKQSNQRSKIHETEKFSKLTRAITERVAEADSKLTNVKLSIQKEFTEYATECQFVSKSVSKRKEEEYRCSDIIRWLLFILAGRECRRFGQVRWHLDQVLQRTKCNRHSSLQLFHEVSVFNNNNNSAHKVTLIVSFFLLLSVAYQSMILLCMV